ncbi:MAG: hypothetical protein ACKON7_07930 [Planctomycetaceae bacterium]
MRDPLSEAEGCDLLARVFRARGYAIKRDVTFNELGVRFRIDGWDARSRVGFEFLSSEAHDHDELTLGEFKRLMAAQQRGELAIFVVDESEQLSQADLAAAATEFLDEFAASRGPRRAARRRAAPRKKRSAPAAKPASRPRRKARPKR